MSEVFISVYEDQKTILERISAKVTDYNWLWNACRASKSPIQAYAELRKNINSDQPYFIGTLSTGIRFVGDARDFPSAWHAINPDANSALIKQMIDHIPPSGCDVVDIGANIGVVSASVAMHLEGRGNVFAFEPSPSTYELAAATIALNGVENVILIKSAVGKQEGSVKFFATPGNSGISSLLNHGFKFLSELQEIEVPICQIDNFFKGRESSVGIMKIDVEGAEIDVIEGASQFISNSLPLVIFEYTPVAAVSHGWTDMDAIRSLSKSGSFDFYAVSEEAEGAILSFPLPANCMDQVNVFSVPSFGSTRTDPGHVATAKSLL
ncbi:MULTISPECIES: FkbM family methyltransferase [unclassified Methylobacterium]|uniref:FkbM family methyltransferase n=1 Tax=unclassified Methylobacterium TaxID=2615210 RepID=UPI0036F82890